MKGIKCVSCGKLIAKEVVPITEGKIAIKCEKCGTVNELGTAAKPYGERLVYNQK
jgi:phage FluMu protein Com